MRVITETFKVYKFEELSEEAKKVALEKLYDINVAFDWWDCTFKDLDSQLDIEVESFDRKNGFSILLDGALYGPFSKISIFLLFLFSPVSRRGPHVSTTI